MRFQSQHEADTAMLIVLTLEICYAFGFVCTGCEIVEKLSGLFNRIGDVINQFSWYLLPIEIKQMLPTIILTTQCPVVLKCFGSISCLRDAFKKVNLIK